MTRDQKRRALRYVSDHLPVPALPPALQELLPPAAVDSDTPTARTTPVGGSSPRQRTPRWDLSQRTVEKRPDGRIAEVTEPPVPTQKRVAVGVALMLLIALASALTFVLTQWTPRFDPTGLRTLQPGPAAADARAALVTDDRGFLLMATELPVPAPGFHYVAWRSEGEGWTRLGALQQVSATSFRLRLPRGGDRVDEVTIERTDDSDGARGPVVLQGLTSP